MYNSGYIKKCLFFDIETTSRHKDFDTFEDQEPLVAKIWLEKASQTEKFKHDPRGSYETSACLYPEYGKIVCISYGYWNTETEKWAIESINDEDSDEKAMLRAFAAVLNTKFRTFILSGFNIKNFDIPFVYRRMLIHGILPPYHFDMCEKKPWDIKAYDLYKVWSDAGSINGMCNFELLCALMGIESPKDGEVSGYNVGEAYFEGKIKEITEYCQKDVKASIRLAAKLSSDALKEYLD